MENKIYELLLEMNKDMNKQFEKMDKRFDTLETKVDELALNQKEMFSSIRGAFLDNDKLIKEELGYLGTRIKEVDKKVNHLENRLNN